MHHRANTQSTDDIDKQNKDAGRGIATHELARAVHRAIKIRLSAHLGATFARLILCDQTSVQIGVDRHLFTRHGIEGKARADFGDSPGALGDDDKVDNRQNNEDHNADGVIATDDKLPEGFNDVAGSTRAGMAV